MKWRIMITSTPKIAGKTNILLSVSALRNVKMDTMQIKLREYAQYAAVSNVGRNLGLAMVWGWAPAIQQQ